MKEIVTTVPLVTLRDSNDAVDLESNGLFMEKLAVTIKSVLVMGTTGEWVNASYRDHWDMLELALTHFENVSFNISKLTKEEIRETIIHILNFLKSMPQKRVTLVYVPNQLTWREESIEVRIQNILDLIDEFGQGKIDLMLYDIDIPDVTEPVSDELIAYFAQHDCVSGLKNSRTSPDGIAARVRFVKNLGLKYFNGPDSSMMVALLAGADGVVSGLGNVVPKLVLKLVNEFSKPDALAIQDRINQVFAALVGFHKDDFRVGLKAIAGQIASQSHYIPGFASQEVDGLVEEVRRLEA